MVDKKKSEISDLLNQAHNNIKQKRFLSAQSLLTKILKQEPYNPEALYLLGLTSKVLKNYDIAYLSYEATLFTTLRPRALHEMAKLAYQTGHLDNALNCYEDLYSELVNNLHTPERYHKLIDALEHIAEIYKLRQNYDAAILTYEKIILEEAHNPFGENKDKFKAYLEIGNCFFSQAQIALAIKYYNKVLTKKNPYYNHALFNIAKINFNNHNLEESISILKQILTRRPSKEIEKETRILLANSYAANLEFSKAVQTLKPLINKQPSTDILERYVIVLFKAQKFTELIALWQSQSIKSSKALPLYLLATQEVNKTLNSQNNYNENFTYQNLINRLSNSKDLSLKFNGKIKNIYKEAKKNLISAYYYGSDNFDHYIIPLVNCGTVNFTKTDFIHVQTVINTKQIADITPCHNLNGEYSLNLQKNSS